jgi:hypothetical protein
MKVCSEIKRRIDEAEDVEQFDIEVARHTDACGECRRFADERAALRNLLATTARVTAPPNFDAVLEARLAAVKAHQPLAWLNPAFYLRVGAATAALAVAVFVAQYNGLFGTSPVEETQPQAQANTSGLIAGAIQDKLPSQFVTPQTPANSAVAMRDTARGEIAVAAIGGRAGNHLRATRRGAGVPLLAPVDAAFVDSGAILIPGRNGGRDITVPTVSVGAQPMLYGNAGRQPQTTRTVPVSF